MVAGGEVKRELRGLPDDYYSSTAKGWLHNNNASTIGNYGYPPDLFLSTCVRSSSDGKHVQRANFSGLASTSRSNYGRSIYFGCWDIVSDWKNYFFLSKIGMSAQRFFTIVTGFGIATFLMALSYVVFFTDVRGDNCDHHKELFMDSIKSGVVLQKYVDNVNHAVKTVQVRSMGKTYDVLFIPFHNWQDFDSVKVGDSVYKPARSFRFTLNGRHTFVLNYECAYNY